jgi:thiamine pyrophosphate-dependent acetolactate synthase large subunit-like protein
MATSGPGAIHLLNGLYDAKLAGRRALHLGEVMARARGIRHEGRRDAPAR